MLISCRFMHHKSSQARPRPSTTRQVGLLRPNPPHTLAKTSSMPNFARYHEHTPALQKHATEAPTGQRGSTAWMIDSTSAVVETRPPPLTQSSWPPLDQNGTRPNTAPKGTSLQKPLTKTSWSTLGSQKGSYEEFFPQAASIVTSNYAPPRSGSSSAAQVAPSSCELDLWKHREPAASDFRDLALWADAPTDIPAAKYAVFVPPSVLESPKLDDDASEAIKEYREPQPVFRPPMYSVMRNAFDGKLTGTVSETQIGGLCRTRSGECPPILREDKADTYTRTRCHDHGAVESPKAAHAGTSGSQPADGLDILSLEGSFRSLNLA